MASHEIISRYNGWLHRCVACQLVSPRWGFRVLGDLGPGADAPWLLTCAPMGRRRSYDGGAICLLRLCRTDNRPGDAGEVVDHIRPMGGGTGDSMLSGGFFVVRGRWWRLIRAGARR